MLENSKYIVPKAYKLGVENFSDILRQILGIKGTVKKIGPIFSGKKKLWMCSLLLILYDYVHLEVSSGLPTSVQPLEVEILKFYTG